MRKDIRLLLVVTAGIGVLTLGMVGPTPTHPTTASSIPPPCTSCSAAR